MAIQGEPIGSVVVFGWLTASTTQRRCNGGLSARSFVAGSVHLAQYAGGNAMFTVTVFGGKGFFGRRLVRRLVAEGATVRVAVRHADRARDPISRERAQSNSESMLLLNRKLPSRQR
jgi:hypothetical protein